MNTTKNEINNFLTNIMVNENGIDPSTINRESKLSDLGIDSFGFLEVIFSIEHEYGISFPKSYEHLVNVQDVIDETHSLITTKTAS